MDFKHDSFSVNQGLYSLSGKTSYQQIGKSRSREIGYHNDRIALKFDRHLGSSAADVGVKFHSDWKTQTRLRDFARSCGRTSARLVDNVPVAPFYTHPRLVLKKINILVKLKIKNELACHSILRLGVEIHFHVIQ